MLIDTLRDALRAVLQMLHGGKSIGSSRKCTDSCLRIKERQLGVDSRFLSDFLQCGWLFVCIDCLNCELSGVAKARDT